MVRRRRDQLDAGRRVAQLGDVLRNLASRKLAAFTGLGALRDLDLQHFGAGEVFRRDAEAAGGDLLDLRLERVPLDQWDVDLDAPLVKARLQRLARLDERVAAAGPAPRPPCGARGAGVPRRLRRYSICRCGGSWRRRAWHAPRSTSSRATCHP